MQTDLEHLRRCLLEEWDPIGIANEPAAQDEYDLYAIHIEAQMLAGASMVDVRQYLLETEQDRMALAPDLQRAEIVVQHIFRIYRRM